MKIMNEIQYLLIALKANIGILISIITAFIFPIQTLLLLVFIFIVLDTITGVIRAVKLREGFTSRKFASLISKLLLYNISLISVFVLEKYLLFEFVLLLSSIPLLITKIIAIFFCSVEIVSINENVTKITGMNLFQEFKRILFRVKNIKGDIQEITGD